MLLYWDNVSKQWPWSWLEISLTQRFYSLATERIPWLLVSFYTTNNLGKPVYLCYLGCKKDQWHKIGSQKLNLNLHQDERLKLTLITLFSSVNGGSPVHTANLHLSSAICSVNPNSLVFSLLLYAYVHLPLPSLISLQKSRACSNRNTCRSFPFFRICFGSQTWNESWRRIFPSVSRFPS